jgi:hypothetical protein
LSLERITVSLLFTSLTTFINLTEKISNFITTAQLKLRWTSSVCVYTAKKCHDDVSSWWRNRRVSSEGWTSLDTAMSDQGQLSLARQFMGQVSMTHHCARSQWPSGLKRGSAAARLLGFWVGIRPGSCTFVFCESCALSGRGLCERLIPRIEETYRLWCVIVCDLETSKMRRPRPALGCCARQKNPYVYGFGLPKN